MQLKEGIYKHYKGQYYRVYYTARHSETEEIMVVYQQMYGNKAMWVRPYSMFVETIFVNGKQQKRFELVDK